MQVQENLVQSGTVQVQENNVLSGAVHGAVLSGALHGAGSGERVRHRFGAQETLRQDRSDRSQLRRGGLCQVSLCWITR